MKRSSTILRIFLTAACCLLLSHSGYSQQKKERKWTLGGYVKDLRTLSMVGSADSLLFDSQIHNRLNFRWFPSDKWTVGAELRNRFFYGQSVRLNPFFYDFLDQDNGLVDLSFVWFKSNYFAGHTKIDRAWVQYSQGKWDFRAGRQRINWGINLAWNPNDLFNAYNYLDFDYEERPGADAIRVERHIGALSSLELAVAPARELKQSTAALLYKFHKGSYDLQLLGGYYREDLAVGGGWAGNLGPVGFKGEGTYFQPLSAFADSLGDLSLSVGLDYLFGSGLYLNLGALYNTTGANRPFALNLLSGNLSAKSLSPWKYTLFTQISAPLSPLTQASGGIMCSPTDGTLFLMPSLGHSIATNWDLLGLGQLLFADAGAGYGFAGGGVFVRLKRSF